MNVMAEVKITILDGEKKGSVHTFTTVGETQPQYTEIGVIERLRLEWNNFIPYKNDASLTGGERMNKKSECKYCKFINEDMPLEKDRGREVTEIRYSTKDNNLFYWGHHYRIPLNFCPNCGEKMIEPQESEDEE